MLREHRLTIPPLTICFIYSSWKRLDGPELDGPEHFEKKCKKVPGDAGAAAGATAGAAATASAAAIDATTTFVVVKTMAAAEAAAAAAAAPAAAPAAAASVSE